MKSQTRFNALMASAISLSIVASPSSNAPAFAQSAPAAEAPGDTGWQKEFEMWRTVNKAGQASDYQTYLRLYPRGKFANVAKQRIAEMTSTPKVADNTKTAAVSDTKGVEGADAANNVNELELWRQVSKAGKQADYEKYLKQFPNGKFAKVAKTRIEKLSGAVTDTAQTDETTAPPDNAAANADQGAVEEAPDMAEQKPASNAAEKPASSDWEQEYAVWKAASDGNTVAEYESYLKAYPEGKFAAIAQARIVQLSAAETPDPTISEGDENQSDGPANAANQTDEQPQADVQDQQNASQDQDNSGQDQDTAGQAPSDEQPADDQAAADDQSNGDQQANAYTEGSEEAEDGMLDRETRHEIQGRLSSLGYDTQGTDGAFGPRTRDAIASWQQDNGAPVTGYLSEDQVNAIFSLSAASYASWLATRAPVMVRRVRPRAELVVIRPRSQIMVVKRRPGVVLVRPGAVVKFKNRARVNAFKFKVKVRKCRRRNRC